MKKSLQNLGGFFHSGRNDQLLGSLFLDSGLSSSQTCDGHAERRAAHVVQAGLVEEADRSGVAAMFAADAALQVGALATATLHTEFHQLTDTFLVEGVERVGGDDLLFDVVLHDGVDVVAAEAEGGWLSGSRS